MRRSDLCIKIRGCDNGYLVEEEVWNEERREWIEESMQYEPTPADALERVRLRLQAMEVEVA